MLEKLFHARGGIVGLAFICLLCLLQPAPADETTYFDWRHVDGKDYTTPIRNQNLDNITAGTCWAFAAVAALECKLEICYDLPDWNPDLSEQHLVCDGYAGNASYGWDYKALQFIRDTGVVTEAELPYTALNTSPDWPLAEGWEDRVYTITAYEKLTNYTTDNVKLMLRTHGPLVASFNAGTDWDDSDFILPPDSAPPTAAPGDASNGDYHTACVIGYMDDETILNGGYWIIKNSWGTESGRDNGYFYIPYEVMESHNAIYAITGEALAPVPEPASMVLLSMSLTFLWKRRKTVSP